MTLSKTSVQPLDLDDLERQLREVAASSLPRKSDDPLAELARIVGRDGSSLRGDSGRGPSMGGSSLSGRRREGPGRRRERPGPPRGSGVRPRGLDQGGASGRSSHELAEDACRRGFRRRWARSSRRAGVRGRSSRVLRRVGGAELRGRRCPLCRGHGQLRRRRGCSGHAGRGGARGIRRDDAVSRRARSRLPCR